LRAFAAVRHPQPIAMTSYGGSGDQAGRSGGGKGGHKGRSKKTQQQLVVWAEDQASFRIEQEACGISDHTVRDWLSNLQKELHPWSQKLNCSIMNLSRNEIGDYAIREITTFFIQEGIPVQMMKLYKNWISDDGMRAVGDLIKFSPDPVVQEIHLSHNYITQDGALAILQAVQESKRYPCNRGREGSPLWLRMENNHINWEPVFEKLTEWDFPWASGDSRDAWRKDTNVCPLVSMHRTYHHQTPSAASGGEPQWTKANDAWSEGGHSSSSIGKDAGAGAGAGAAQAASPQPASRDSAHEAQVHAGGSRWNGIGGGKPREAQWSRSEWEGWDRPVASEEDSAYYKDEVDAQFRQFVELSLVDAGRVQVEKFNLIFSILHEMQERQGKLDVELTEILEMARQQQQQQGYEQGYAVQHMVDGGQWSMASTDQHHFGGSVW
jgi:hypothetical protein